MWGRPGVGDGGRVLGERGGLAGGISEGVGGAQEGGGGGRGGRVLGGVLRELGLGGLLGGVVGEGGWRGIELLLGVGDRARLARRHSLVGSAVLFLFHCLNYRLFETPLAK